MSSQRFGKDRRVRRRSEFSQVFDFSLRAHGRYFTVLIAPTKTGSTRLGIVASRKLGNAVQRNMAKRLIREVFRRTSRPGPSVDVVVIPRRELFDAPYASLETDFRATFARCVARLPVNAAR
jgi:ribonuclease P protein component